MAYLAAHSRCCLCGRPAYSTGGFSLWCLKCLQPFIDAAADYVPVVTMRRAAARQDAVAVPA
jgi:ribosomal protein L37AE/L43A